MGSSRDMVRKRGIKVFGGYGKSGKKRSLVNMVRKIGMVGSSRNILRKREIMSSLNMVQEKNDGVFEGYGEKERGVMRSSGKMMRKDRYDEIVVVMVLCVDSSFGNMINF